MRGKTDMPGGRENTHTRLEVIAGADNPYSLTAIFDQEHL
jgi:hypothetical protein